MNPLTTLELLLSLSVQVALLIGVAAYIARRRFASSHADQIWAATQIAILILTTAAFVLPHLRLATWADLHPASNYPAGRTTLQVLGSVAGWTWALGVLGIGLIGIAGLIKATAIVGDAHSDRELQGRLFNFMPDLAACSRPPDIRVLHTSIGAFCWQIHCPVIALPDVVAEFPIAEQAAIVRHELAHLRRQHPLHLFLQRLVEAIYWFHPLVWWGSRQAAAAREICCDQDAVASRHDVAVYLRSMLRLIELQLSAPTLLPAGLAFLGDASLLRLRANLLAESFDGPVKPASKWRPLLGVTMTGLICLIIWLPVNPRASRRADWSPWPRWSARSLNAIGIDVRDYEVDGHRLDGHDTAADVRDR